MRESDIAGEPSLPIPPSPDESGRRLSILLIIMCQIAAMALWFSASAAVPSLLDANQLSTDAAAALTSAVQIGFVAGTLASAGWGLADRFDSRALFSTAAVLGALFNGALLLCGFDHPAAPLLRFATGMCMAGIYPVVKDMVLQTPAAEETDVLVQAQVAPENDADAVPEGAGPAGPTQEGTQFDFQKALPLVAVAGAALYLATRKKGK